MTRWWFREVFIKIFEVAIKWVSLDTNEPATMRLLQLRVKMKENWTSIGL